MHDLHLGDGQTEDPAVILHQAERHILRLRDPPDPLTTIQVTMVTN